MRTLLAALLACWVTIVAADLRVVDGRVYNTSRSTNWVDVAGYVVELHTNQMAKLTNWGASVNPYADEFYVLNTPTNWVLATWVKARAMKVGSTNGWELWDCGIPTNLTQRPGIPVPANRKAPVP